jgi:hypothetical protein
MSSDFTMGTAGTMQIAVEPDVPIGLIEEGSHRSPMELARLGRDIGLHRWATSIGLAK